MSTLRWLDFIVVVAYMAAMVYLGVRFSKRQTSTEHYFVGARSIPGWAAGMSLFATLVSSVTYVAYPGAAYGGGWSLLIPGLVMLGVVALVGYVIVPFYRQEVGMSAYEYFGNRFGRPTRMYSSMAFSLGHFSKMGFVIYLLALTIDGMTGWGVDRVIVGVALVTIFYTVIGGLEAVIWSDVIQAFIMWLGVFIILGYLLFLPPGGPSAVFNVAWENNKFSMGSTALDFSKPTIIVLIIYGIFWYLQKYLADQTAVQRYLVAKSERAALRGLWLGAFLSSSVWAVFMLIGTCVWAFYRLTGAALPAGIKADQVFPYFLSTQIPAGIAGLFVASLLAAAMSTLASDLNCIALVASEDFYRVLKPSATDRQRLRFGKTTVAVFGFLALFMALILAHMGGSALSMWFSATAILSGGLAGLFLLAFLSQRTNTRGVYIGIVANLLFTAWATLTMPQSRILDLGRFNFPWHDYMIGAIGNVVVFVVGYLGSLLFARETESSPYSQMTIWHWLKRRREAAPAVVPAGGR